MGTATMSPVKGRVTRPTFAKHSVSPRQDAKSPKDSKVHFKKWTNDSKAIHKITKRKNVKLDEKGSQKP